LKKNGIIVGELLIANDSVFGPVNPIENIVQEWRQSGADFYGMTDSYEIKHHLQSYFMLFSRSVLESQAFDDFWENVGVVKDKSTLIFKYEIGLSRSLVAAGFEMGCLGKAKSLGFLNNSHARWEDLVTDFGNPFVKIELLRDNPMEIDLSRFRAVISNQSDYDIGLIEEQLKRSGVTIETWQSCES
jgi:lipopolysaccharide biosynthesis protein